MEALLLTQEASIERSPDSGADDWTGSKPNGSPIPILGAIKLQRPSVMESRVR